MSKKHNPPNVATVTDGYQNLISRVGANSGNIVNSGGYAPTFLTKNRQALDWMHRGNWIVGKVIDGYADDMTREGIEFKGSDTPAEISALDAAMIELDIMPSIGNAIKWGRLYGGAIAVIELDGPDVSTPLRIETVGPGQFKGLSIYDRWQLVPDVNTPISDAYIDDGSGAFYVNTTSLSTGWVLVTGGSGVAQVIPGAFDDPNGHVTPSNPLLGAVYYRDQASPVVFWGWSVSNVNWFPIIT